MQTHANSNLARDLNVGALFSSAFDRPSALLAIPTALAVIWLALIIAACCLAIAYHFGISGWMVVSLEACALILPYWAAARRAVKRGRAREADVRSCTILNLLETDDVSAVGPLMDLLPRMPPFYQRQIRDALTRLLPNVERLDRRRHAALSRLLSDDRETLLEPDLAIAALLALTKIEAVDCLPVVDRRTAGDNERVRETAQRCAADLRRCAARLRVSRSLLRPADKGAERDLLHPARTLERDSPDMLLRVAPIL